MSRLKNYVSVGVLTAVCVVGLTVAPVVSAATTGSTALQAIVGWTISMDSVAPAATQLNIAPAAGGTQTTRSTAVTITTNDSAGYTLSHNTSSATLANGGNTIPSTAGTWIAPIALANNTWGYALVGTTPGLTPGSNGFDTTYADINSLASSALKYAAVPTGSTAVRSTSATATAEVTTFWYSAKIDNTKPSGTYSATMSYSVVGKP